MPQRTRIQQAVGLSAPFIQVFPPPIIADRAPTSNDLAPLGQVWIDKSGSAPFDIYTFAGNGVWDVGGIEPATTTTFGSVKLTDNSEPVATKAYADALAIAGSPVATTTTSGIGKLVSDANAVARIASTGAQAYFVQPSNLTAVMSAPGPIGDTTPSTASFTDLTASGTISLDTTVGTHYKVTGAADLTLQSTAGSIVVNGGEAVADAIQLTCGSGAGGITAVAGTGGVTLTNTGALSLAGSGASNVTIATGDLSIIDTASSIILNAGEAVADAIQLTTANAAGGVTMSLGTGGFNPTTTGKFTMVSTDNASQAFYLHANGGASETIQLRADQGTGDASVELLSDVGGVTLTGGKAAATAINLTTSNAAGGVTMTVGTGGILPTTTGKFTVISTDNAAQAIELHANGGTSETVRLRADQGTAATSLDLLSDVGGITLNAGLGSASAINITSSAAGGGWTLNSGTAGVTLTNTGKLSLAAAAASDITVTGAFDLTLASTLGRGILQSAKAAADAIKLNASDAAGGITAVAGTGGVTLTNTGALSLGGSGASNITIATGDLSLIDTASSIVINAGEAVADAIQLNASNAAGGIDVQAGTGGLDVDTTGAISIDGAAASNLTTTSGDLTLSATTNSVVISGSEAVQDAVQVLSPAGGLKMLQAGGAGLDTTITNTAGSLTISAGESVSDAFNLTAGGAASGMTLSAGTSSITLSSGLKVKDTALSHASTPYAVLGTDYVLNCDTSGGVLTITLPAAPSTGRTLWINDIAGAAGVSNITIDGNGKNLAGGAAIAGTKVISANYAGAFIEYNGTLWAYRYIA